MNNEQKVLGSRGQDICDRTRAFALVIIETYRSLKKDDVGRVIGKQLLRSGTSIGANVEEAQSAESRKDFVHKMSIALKESRETHYQRMQRNYPHHLHYHPQQQSQLMNKIFTHFSLLILFLYSLFITNY